MASRSMSSSKQRLASDFFFFFFFFNNNIFISYIKYTNITPPANSKANDKANNEMYLNEDSYIDLGLKRAKWISSRPRRNSGWN